VIKDSRNFPTSCVPIFGVCVVWVVMPGKWCWEIEKELVLIKPSEIFRRVVDFLRERFEVFIVRHTVPVESAQLQESMDTIRPNRTQSRAY
jgi:hypothetical protein